MDTNCERILIGKKRKSGKSIKLCFVECSRLSHLKRNERMSHVMFNYYQNDDDRYIENNEKQHEMHQ